MRKRPSYWVSLGWNAGKPAAVRVESGAVPDRARLVQMHVHELGADIEALERGPNEVGADPRLLEVRDADRAAKSVERIG